MLTCTPVGRAAQHLTNHARQHVMQTVAVNVLTHKKKATAETMLPSTQKRGDKTSLRRVSARLLTAALLGAYDE